MPSSAAVTQVSSFLPPSRPHFCDGEDPFIDIQKSASICLIIAGSGHPGAHLRPPLCSPALRRPGLQLAPLHLTGPSTATLSRPDRTRLPWESRESDRRPGTWSVHQARADSAAGDPGNAACADRNMHCEICLIMSDKFSCLKIRTERHGLLGGGGR